MKTSEDTAIIPIYIKQNTINAISRQCDTFKKVIGFEDIVRAFQKNITYFEFRILLTRQLSNFINHSFKEDYLYIKIGN